MATTNESDPFGMPQHAPGAKLDGEKPLTADVLSMFANAIKQVVAVGTFGARKYTLGGWLQVPDGRRRYENALMRHCLASWSGEEVDPESQMLHDAHRAWNALAALELKMRGLPR